MVKIKKKEGRGRKEGGAKNTQSMQFNHALGQHILKNPLIVQVGRARVHLCVILILYCFCMAALVFHHYFSNQ